MIKEYLKRKAAKRIAQERLGQARHLRNMREELMSHEERLALADAEQALRIAIKSGEDARIHSTSETLYACIERSSSHIGHRSSWAEHAEVLIVAFAVAMAFRSYFLQPFKIPTGSMQPTLNGVICESMAAPGLTDHMPLKVVKWILFGEWYSEVWAQESGYLMFPTQESATENPSKRAVFINNRKHLIPRGARLQVGSDGYVQKGQLLWSGIVRAGDHVFVDRIRWRLRKPSRGEVMVFSTDAIRQLTPGMHYIKRLVATPGETIAIDSPNLLINGNPVSSPESIARIARRDPGYPLGYVPAAGESNYLRTKDDPYSLKADEFWAMGDNTGNSRDSRCWGPVPRKSLVGPAVFVYWPLSHHWGPIRR